MIQHYALYETNKLTDTYGLDNGLPKGVKPRYNISPAQPAMVILRRGKATVGRNMGWGLLSKGAKDTNSVFRYKTFNVPSEKVFAKASWDTAVRQTRCIIPMNGFYMIRDETKDVYYFSHSDGALINVAGLYSEWDNNEGETVSTFSLLTIASNNAMPLPFGTMPVLLDANDHDKWLDPTVNDMSTLITCMRPYEGAPLKYAKVSSDVTTKQDDPSLILPIK